ncbi:hypothetical protein GJAV_G00065880 [Gymnothorax javanicus]|nr:hypothetical protein GJAV_G00065880 [Gymnothorax javanicus]
MLLTTNTVSIRHNSRQKQRFTQWEASRGLCHTCILDIKPITIQYVMLRTSRKRTALRERGSGRLLSGFVW